MTTEITVKKTSGKVLGKISVIHQASIGSIKQSIYEKFRIKVARQSIRSKQQKGADLSNHALITEIKWETPSTVYVKDLGPQISWSTVFFTEYAGPLYIYTALMLMPHCFYSQKSIENQIEPSYDYRKFFETIRYEFVYVNSFCSSNVVYHIGFTTFYAWILWTLHYGKRLWETAYVHRFSHGTMPIFNLFKNCSYYWGFALYVAYHVNHPLYTPPPPIFFYVGCTIFLICELGNGSIHILLRDLRPEGTTVRKIPIPNANILTKLYDYVSCPNYTYEFGSWIGFTLLTGCLPAFLFSIAGLYQMTIWAIAKHKKYKQEFPNYPRNRKAIIPFVI